MKKLPVEIKICPIKETILEIRYSSKIPSDAIFGSLYGELRPFFDSDPQSLPILQLPEAIRRQDPSLKYKAHHQFKKDNLILSIGPDVLVFSNISPYVGWGRWSNFFYEILKKLLKIDVLDKVERVGLRYINIFDDNIFDKVDCEIKIIDDILTGQSTNLRTEILDENIIKVLQIGNSVTMMSDNNPVHGSIIDIDCLMNIDDTSDFFKSYHDIIEYAHNKEKELFFSLLKKEFLEALKPIYGE